ncbi:N-acetyl-1-D-myo-inosityl-2-amino-2-deoxy-alpha- D-glucopyranoside deacetylase MshB [Serinicoccus hydrothermalis]|uniref:N-acetyl-1-D-myo-inositol-2-amino-2-deoxy-alpha-D-glucopyranoside deacetylase n=1 Tax=Serinicoccus hydrothermalis TaxID=1758689 RepID=A0A1B1NG19_9MICO|nr:N-acetyl-1-D-myo-inositol-2-amino-2-deoxy-alpha-D-glucopyranoside deacetylase [Serinicoccus hydrothermalis]ANS80386.1 N-acetyl-1-D-myo-inosityl-2-amino-2-deoxy-alpha- D-glucopyranoside deacetylase MshB [Serinicoccus hydrothermalis]
MDPRPDLRDGMPADRPLRVVAVHAHPDDETLATGLTLAHHVEAGDEVHVVTCTLGEEGEVITPELAHLEGRGEDLAEHRRGELDRAMRALGVRHHLLGGGRPRWRDSGMAGSAAVQHPRAFAGADPEEAAAVLAQQLTALAPDLVLTYDPWGGYGHPDHVQTHRVTARAVELLGAQGAVAPRLMVVLVPASWAREDRAWLAGHVPEGVRSPAGGVARVLSPDDPYPPGVVDDAAVTHTVMDTGALPRQRAALREHPTQVTLHDGWYTLSNDIAARLPGREAYAVWPDARDRLAELQGVPS